MLAVALTGDNHALDDGFEFIMCRAAGMSAGQSSVPWALSVASQVLTFVFTGNELLQKQRPSYAMSISAAAGAIRWGTVAIKASTAWRW